MHSIKNKCIWVIIGYMIELYIQKVIFMTKRYVMKNHFRFLKEADFGNSRFRLIQTEWY